MRRFIDTNILYNKYSNTEYPIDITRQNIVSINALEFLRNIEKVHNNKAKYHIPSSSQSHFYIYDNYMKSHNYKRPFPKEVSDSIIFDFKKDFNSYSLYNNETITSVINERMTPLFQTSISFMGKNRFKEIKSKYAFIINHEIFCHSINSTDIELSYKLLDKFLEQHSFKEDFRNSWNDLLILGKVASVGGVLVSEDKLLNRFAAEELGGKIQKSNEVYEFNFPEIKVKEIKDYTKQESKGYINRGWSFRTNKGKLL